jgi:phosphate transport system substrate-binding protein
MTSLLRRRWLQGAVATAVVSAQPTAWAQGDMVRVGGSGSAVGGMRVLAELFNASGPTRVTVASAVGSAGGIQALLRGDLDVAVTNRAPNEAELAQRALRAIEYARTPFVMAVSASLGITSLSTDQLAELFAPGATFANGQRARPVLRLTDQTDTDLMRSFSPKVAQAVEAAGQRRGMLSASTDVEAADLIYSTPGAFGPSTLALILAERRALTPLTIDGVAPTLENLASGRYLQMKRLLAIAPPMPVAKVAAFLSFLRTPAAQALMRNHGHLPTAS